MKSLLQPYQRMKGWKLWIVPMLSIFLLLSCQDSAQPWESFGEIVQESRTLTAFTKVRLRGKMLVYLTQDSTAELSAQLLWGSNVLKGLSTEVNTEGELVIEDRNQIRWLRRLDTQSVCTLNVHKLDRLVVEDNVQVIALDTIHSEALEVQTVSTHPQLLKVNCGQLFGFIRGTGSVLFEGRGVIFSWSCEKGGNVDSRNMDSDDVYIWNFTQRDVWVNPVKQFQANCYGSGNIFYKQEPIIRFEKVEQGMGRVLKLP